MRRKTLDLILILCMTIVFGCTLTGCDDTSADAADNADAAEGEETEPKESDAYEEYIRSALEGVNGDRPAADGASPTGEGTSGDNTGTPVPKETKDVATDRTAPTSLDVSSMESPDVLNDPSLKDHILDTDSVSPSPTDTVTPSSTGDVSPSPTLDPNATPTPEPTPYITPDEFDVGKCCIYINGESDSGLGTEVVTAINKVRKDLGYKELVKNTSLSTCADRRTRETVARFDHVRPNGQMFYSLAPEHFKAEMIIRSRQKGEEIVDTLIKNDPISKNLIFTEKYQSIGASSFKCNGDQYTVVSFGL